MLFSVCCTSKAKMMKLRLFDIFSFLNKIINNLTRIKIDVQGSIYMIEYWERSSNDFNGIEDSVG